MVSHRLGVLRGGTETQARTITKIRLQKLPVNPKSRSLSERSPALRDD
jgi:hypothetical protein